MTTVLLMLVLFKNQFLKQASMWFLHKSLVLVNSHSNPLILLHPFQFKSHPPFQITCVLFYHPHPTASLFPPSAFSYFGSLQTSGSQRDAVMHRSEDPILGSGSPLTEYFQFHPFVCKFNFSLQLNKIPFFFVSLWYLLGSLWPQCRPGLCGKSIPDF